MTDMRKDLTLVEVKDADKGIVTARFATLGVKDHDGDVIEPGAFGKQEVVVSAYGHTSWQGVKPVGKGTIHEKGDEAIADLKFLLNTQEGREHFEVIKELGHLQQWSFGFDIKEEAAPDEEQRQAGVRRVLKQLKVHEVSPVLLGAGVATQTLAVKGRLPDTDDPAQRERDRQWLKALEEFWSEAYDRLAGEDAAEPAGDGEPGAEARPKGEKDAAAEEVPDSATAEAAAVAQSLDETTAYVKALEEKQAAEKELERATRRLNWLRAQREKRIEAEREAAEEFRKFQETRERLKQHVG